jgi:hypothetical protein
MKILQVLGSLLLVAFGWVFFGGIRYEPAKSPTLPMTNSATARGQDPWMVNEKTQGSVRISARKSALDALYGSSSVLCSEAGRSKIVSSISYYYEMLMGQELGYPRSWGEGAGQYIRQAWATPDDVRIERLTREIYTRGYLPLDDFKKTIRTRIAEVVAKERVTGNPCT